MSGQEVVKVDDLLYLQEEKVLGSVQDRFARGVLLRVVGQKDKERRTEEKRQARQRMKPKLPWATQSAHRNPKRSDSQATKDLT